MGTYNFNKKHQPEMTPNNNDGKKKKHHGYVYYSGNYTNPLTGLVISIILFIVALVVMIVFIKVVNNTDGYTTTQAVISKIVDHDPSPYSENLIAYVTYTVDGVTYEDVALTNFTNDMREKERTKEPIEIWYNIEDPGKNPKVISTVTRIVPIALCGTFMAVTAASAIFYATRVVKYNKKNKPTA